ncbi:MAG: alpha-glucan family phosphorylase [Actinomycetota bacterium]|nr:alpha-glucan family phosphorylase [Actinomycetota bacterium]
MKALRSFTVRPTLPRELAALEALAMNLRWSWDEQTRDLFRWVDPGQWDASIHDPVRLLGLVSPERLEELAADAGFLRFLDEVHTELLGYLSKPRWFQAQEGGSPLRLVAYFSPEYGIAEALPQYSGGLGVLAGDHLKASSDLGVPLVGVGLFYKHGYFRQALDIEGWQQERYPDLDPYGMALTLCDGVSVSVDLAGRPLHARVWRADVGRVPLYLLDADVEENEPELRTVTDSLYGGDPEHRLQQEILLGVGGVRALQALGIDAQVFHTNEGHAGFLGFERIRQQVQKGLAFSDAVEAVRAGTVFTTHTPVPAGIDRFPRPMMERYFGEWAEEVGLDADGLMALGHRTGDLPDERFNMAVMGLRLAARRNAVAQLHGEVSREMFADLWPDVPVDEVPIGAVTNGVHAPTWVSSEMGDVLARHVLPEWEEAGRDRWARIHEARDDELWRARAVGREALVAFIRRRLRESLQSRGHAPSNLSWTDEVLDPAALTICFARRFATYKRATMILSHPERLRSMLLDPERPVQFVFAGKAHPADDNGKAMIQEIARFATDLGVRHRFVFLEDYDIAVARALYQGADVWLNNPRRPQEACGTSGMKAALNGALNCSILDGWWDELFDGENGWAITSAEALEDDERRDREEAESLFQLLETQVVSLFYERRGTTPRRWIEKVKHAFATLGPEVLASRQVRDYVLSLYEPAAAHDTAVRGDDDGFAPARELSAWRSRVLEAWHGVHVDDVVVDEEPVDVGQERTVEAIVALGDLSPDDVEVQAVRGWARGDGDLVDTEVVAMAPAGEAPEGHLRYRVTFACPRAGRIGVTVRVVPSHPLLATKVELGRIAWA